MKKLLTLIAITAVTFGGCKKDDSNSPTPSGGSTAVTITAVPSTFTKKVLIEESTGAWCGWCVDGAYKMQSLIDANAGRVIGASIHNADGMVITSLDNILGTTFGRTGFPQGMVNRVASGSAAFMSRGSWSGVTTSQLALTAECGLAIESALPAPDSCTVAVHCGFKSVLSGNYRLTVYLLEDEVSLGTGSQWDQHNYLSGDPTYSTSPYYSLPSVIVGYKHMHVVRKVMTADLGDVIPTGNIVIGTDYKVNFSYKIPSTRNTAKMRVVAFISKYGASATTHQVMNVQEIKLGSNKNWD